MIIIITKRLCSGFVLRLGHSKGLTGLPIQRSCLRGRDDMHSNQRCGFIHGRGCDCLGCSLNRNNFVFLLPVWLSNQSSRAVPTPGGVLEVAGLRPTKHVPDQPTMGHLSLPPQKALGSLECSGMFLLPYSVPLPFLPGYLPIGQALVTFPVFQSADFFHQIWLYLSNTWNTGLCSCIYGRDKLLCVFPCVCRNLSPSLRMS